MKKAVTLNLEMLGYGNSSALHFYAQIRSIVRKRAVVDFVFTSSSILKQETKCMEQTTREAALP